MLHGIVAGVGRDGAFLADGLVRGAHGDQILQIVGIDVPVGPHVVHDGPSVLELPDGDPGSGIQLHPVGLVLLLVQGLLGHGLPDVAFPGHRGDVLVLLHVERRGVHRVIGQEVLGEIFPLDISQLALIPDDDPDQAHVQHVHIDVLQVPGHLFGLDALLLVDAVSPDHVRDLSLVESRGIHREVLQGLLMVDGVGIRHGDVLRVFALGVLLPLQLLAGKGVLVLLRRGGKRRQPRASHQHRQQERKHLFPESRVHLFLRLPNGSLISFRPRVPQESGPGAVYIISFFLLLVQSRPLRSGPAAGEGIPGQAPAAP